MLDLELLAGDIGGPGSLDGIGADAHFSAPFGMAVDSAGNVYVADANGNTIRKITPAGAVTTLAGAAWVSGSANGTAAAARFYHPNGLAVDRAGNGYVADTDNCTIRKITVAGIVTTLAGAAGAAGSADGTGAAARFYLPWGVAVDATDNVYIADTYNHSIRKITPSGVVTTLAGTSTVPGSADGTGGDARFRFPAGVAVDGANNVYVADAGNRTVRAITPAGVVTTLAGTAGIPGNEDGTGSDARFFDLAGVATDDAGNVYVTDADTVRAITPAGVVTTLAGTAGISGNEDGTGSDAHFSGPVGIAVDSAHHVYVADTDNDAVRAITPAGVVTTLAGTPIIRGTADGTGSDARFSFPAGVAVDGTGNIYVADKLNSTIRKVTPSGVVTTLAGAAAFPGYGDGTGVHAFFHLPEGVAVDSTGNIYVADTVNFIIRKVNPAGEVTTLAGAATVSGSADGIGTDARFSYPSGVAVDATGNVYVADAGNGTIRKVTPAGVVTTLAGTAGVPGNADGAGGAAQFFSPAGVALDAAGNLYVADQGNATIRKITPAGVVTTLAGAPTMRGSADGVGPKARFDLPSGVVVDGAGNVYVADANATLRKVTPSGVTTTIAGVADMSGVLLGTTPRLAFPQGLGIVGDSIVISDAQAILLLRHGAR